MLTASDSCLLLLHCDACLPRYDQGLLSEKPLVRLYMKSAGSAGLPAVSLGYDSASDQAAGAADLPAGRLLTAED
eukprot:COSAG01_NODE_9981_length_2284_cov_25.900229_1_plen_75_part_00